MCGKKKMPNFEDVKLESDLIDRQRQLRRNIQDINKFHFLSIDRLNWLLPLASTNFLSPFGVIHHHHLRRVPSRALLFPQRTFWARLKAVCDPKFSGHRTILVHEWQGHPPDLFQPLRGLEIISSQGPNMILVTFTAHCVQTAKPSIPS